MYACIVLVLCPIIVEIVYAWSSVPLVVKTHFRLWRISNSKVNKPVLIFFKCSYLIRVIISVSALKAIKCKMWKGVVPTHDHHIQE